MYERADLTLPNNNESVLQVLFDHYFESRGADDSKVEQAYRVFRHSLLDVDSIIADGIMSCAAVLCMEHERAGFVAGIRAGMRLNKELSE